MREYINHFQPLKVEISQLRVKLHTKTIHFAKAIYSVVNVENLAMVYVTQQ